MTGDPQAPWPASWAGAALDPLRAAGRPTVSGRLRVAAEDFRVEERLGFEPDGGTAHVLLRVEKTDANTLYVARVLARHAGVRPADVGFAGLKDRRAVATQWFSVPAPRGETDWGAWSGDGFRILEAYPHSRKLRRGALSGNRFHIVLRGLSGDPDSLPPRLQQVAAQGAPNYFGSQRFGREGANLAGVGRWLQAGTLPRDHDQRGFILSAARSLAFNTVLQARVDDGSWDRLLPGEVVNLAGSASVFVAAEIEESLAERCRRHDVGPTGPLPGRGGIQPVGAAAEVERRALEPLAGMVGFLASADVDAARRPLRVVPEDLQWTIEGDVLRTAFGLPRGAFATALLRELVDFDAGDVPAEPE